MQGWLTLDSIPARANFVLSLPDSESWIAQFLGAILALTKSENWEEFGALTSDEMSDEWRAVLFDFINQGGDVVLEDIEAETLRLTSTVEATLSSTGHALQVGPDGGPNVVVDQDEIQARNNGALANLNLNPNGGNTVSPFLRATAAGAVSLASGNHALMVGNANVTNIAVSTTEIQARNNGAIATLNLNPLGGVVKIVQPSTTAAIPPVHLKQSDLSEEFIRFESTVAAGNPINTTGLGAYYGRVRVYIEGVGAKWLALYD